MLIKPFKLERFYTIYEFTAKYQLCNSDCEALTIGELLALEEGAQEKFNQHWLGYTETKGSPTLRDAIANTYQNLNAADLLVCSGAQEPIYLFSQALLQAKDEVIVQWPCYQSVVSVPESLGCTVRKWEVHYKNNIPTFDLEELEQLITNRTKILFLNTPHNPTGFHFSKSEQQALIELARKHKLIIFSDEVYREIEHEPQYAIPAFGDVYENGVSLGVMSKAYGLPGLRIGWLASKNHQLLEQVAILKEYTTICNAAPSEFLAEVALRNRKTILARNLQVIQSNLPLLDQFFTKYADAFAWYRPNAGPISFVKMLFDDSEGAFCKKVLEQKKVLLLPSEVYDCHGFFRVGFGRKAMPEALKQMEAFMEEYF